MSSISVLTDLPDSRGHGLATVDALSHAIDAVAPDLSIKLVRTNEISPDFVQSPGPVVIGPGSPFDRPDLAEAVIRSAREQGHPLVGT